MPRCSWFPTLPITLAGVIAVMSSAVPARAQAAGDSSFASLRSRLSVDDLVSVTDMAGKVLDGDVEEISNATLVIRNGSRAVTLRESDIRRIVRRGHAIRNGALVGLAAGAWVGAAYASRQPCTVVCFSSPGGILLIGGLSGAMGLGAGAAVGALVRHEPVVFESRSGAITAVELTVSGPPGGAGLQLRLAW